MVASALTPPAESSLDTAKTSVPVFLNTNTPVWKSPAFLNIPVKHLTKGQSDG